MDFGIETISMTKVIQPDNVRMTGFLEKKGKMKLVSPWKKYWFVLEKRLLLYYRSEIEYANLSPCRGSLNMGLVTTVRPGSSTGPCVIHIVTRTQAVQLRAKNRAAQEEWLQALLNSMNFPVVPKVLKLPSLKPKLISQTASLENVSIYKGWKKTRSVEDWSLPRGLNYSRRQISGSYYGGSLDTTIWTKKFRPLKTPIFLETSKELDSKNLVNSFQKELSRTVNHDVRSRTTDRTLPSEKTIPRKNGQKKCKVHDEILNSFSECSDRIVERQRKISLIKVHPPNMDNEMKKKEESEQLLNSDKNYESPFQRLKHALGRMPKENILKIKPEVESKGSSKKRRKSFLRKVFRRIGQDGHEIGKSEVDADFYDVQLQKEASNRLETHEKQATEVKTKEQNVESVTYAEIKKKVSGSKTESTKSDSKTKMASGSSVEEEVVTCKSNEPTMEATADSEETQIKEEKASMAPLLPPRRVSRPVSPWHDIPTNNAPIDSEKKTFFSHQSMVKFKDSFFKSDEDFPRNFDQTLTTEEDKSNLSESNEISREKNDSKLQDDCKQDDLSILLEQLTKITVAPLEDSLPSIDPPLCSSDSLEKGPKESEMQDPDYDVPRPHNGLNAVLSECTQNQMICSDVDNFIKKYQENFDEKSWSLRSIEPDSLELFTLQT